MSARKKTGAAEDGGQPKPRRTKAAKGALPAEAGEPVQEPREAEEIAEAAASDAPAPESSAVGLPESYSGRAVVFVLEGRKYALPVEQVQEIQQLVAYTEVPDPMPALIGMVNLRGLVVPLLDLRLLLGMEPATFRLETPMMICRTHGSLAALVVDEVEDVVEVPPTCVQPPSRLHALAEKMLGVCQLDTSDLVFLLHLDRVMPGGAVARGGAR